MSNIFLRDSTGLGQKKKVKKIIKNHQTEPVFQSPPWYELMALPQCQPRPHLSGTTVVPTPWWMQWLSGDLPDLWGLPSFTTPFCFLRFLPFAVECRPSPVPHRNF